MSKTSRANDEMIQLRAIKQGSRPVPAKIKIAIRADAGQALGTGHYARARAVSDALLAGGGTDILLVTSEESAQLVPAYFGGDTAILSLAGEDAGAAQAMAEMQCRGWLPDVIYLDHYGQVPEWETEAARTGARLLVLDDLDAATSADVIVRPHGGNANGVSGLLLRGPSYMPIAPHFVTPAVRTSSKGAKLKPKLNVCFGGSDPTGETAKALQALSGLEEVEADVVIGPGASLDEALIEASDRMPHVMLHRSPSQERVAELLSEADLALGAGGVMLWERACLRVPSLVIAVAENQRQQIDIMAAAGAIKFLGVHSQVTSDKVRHEVGKLAADESARRALAEAGHKLVDGRGSLRLAAWIKALVLDTRDVRREDSKDLFEWRTHDRNWQHNWEVLSKPDFQAHVGWLEARLADPQCVFRIVSYHGEPAGVVRFDLKASRSAYLSIYLVPTWHGRKMGLAVYFAGERSLRKSHPWVRRVVSRIHRENGASTRLHGDAGFSFAQCQSSPDWLIACKRID